MLVEMKATKDGKPAGKAADYFADAFVQKLSKKELVEHLEVEAREAEALAAAAQQPEVAAEKPARKPRKAAEPAGDGTPKKLSAIDAAAKVLAESNVPMKTKEMIDAMAAKGYWTSPGGATPSATLYSAILRKLQKKGAEARFQKTARGHFTINAGSPPAAEPETPAAAPKTKGKKAGKPQAEIPDGTPGPRAVSELFKI
jgi:uncharacterized protein (DUF4415 family)